MSLHTERHRGPEDYCLECRADDEARFALTARGWAASSDEIDRAEAVVRSHAAPMPARGRTVAWNDSDNGVEQHAFSLAAEPVLRRALDLVTQRGGQHGDTWALPMETPFVDTVLGLPLQSNPEWKRLLMCAAFLDMKLIRANKGEWNPDDLSDAVNYASAFNSWRSEYENGDTTDAILDQHRDSRTAG